MDRKEGLSRSPNPLPPRRSVGGAASSTSGLLDRDVIDPIHRARPIGKVAGRLKMVDTSTVQISREAFDTLLRLRGELDEVIETIECLNDPELMASIRRSEQDVRDGKTTRITSADDIDRLWSDDGC
jgi:hypothetical protein